ncbi:hypothetical protein [Luteibaculum oceani]|uniref:Lipoprotein n=1 Tax=Luteibaculum oceani TaxID=1294296 RepID=A0A5C6VLS6_9FLAO|nr:hypothetical protein [Luteibaculum oceani]TXC85456.1 hypothetical protein FRX97_02170 [Luteibaculum oceani]
MMRILSLALALVLFSCATVEQAEQSVEISLSGEMLFSGANTFQTPMELSEAELLEKANLPESQIKSIGVKSVEIQLDSTQRAIMESVLLQVVSDNQEMISIGTKSPLPDGTNFELSLAEEIDLLPYASDAGATWVLDANLTEDYMDLMSVNAKVNLVINYIEK